MTCHQIRGREAPDMRAASSSIGSMLRISAASITNMVGTTTRPVTNTMPPKV